jgi:hypothetical protein
LGSAAAVPLKSWAVYVRIVINIRYLSVSPASGKADRGDGILIQFWFLKQRLIVIGLERQKSEKGNLEQYV